MRLNSARVRLGEQACHTITRMRPVLWFIRRVIPYPPSTALRHTN